MVLEKINCPSCGANIDMDTKGRKSVFCPFCGSQFLINSNEITINKNINISGNQSVNKTVNINKTYTNEAALERERNRDRENERNHKESNTKFFVFLALIIVGVIVFWAVFRSDEQQKKASGMICVGQNSDDLEGENYLVVIKQLESVGLTDITTIDLDDSIWIIRPEDTIETITIDGQASFKSSDYFPRDAKVVISYH